MLTDAEIAGYMGWRGPERITVELRGSRLRLSRLNEMLELDK